jgi:hypothetical protein
MKWLFMLILLILVSIYLTKQEGFTVGKYAYLSPILEATWGQITIQKFVDKYNAMGNEQLKTSTFATDKKGISFMKNALEEEALYYVEHGEWPYNEYVKKYLESNPTTIPSGLKINTVDITSTNIAKYYPNRYVYMAFIAQKEASIKPLPESYQIFKGSALEPEPNDTSANLSTYHP